MSLIQICIRIFVLLFVVSFNNCQKPSFIIDLKNDVFLKDGKPFQYISGSFHYSRVPNYYWDDRLAKCRAAGLNAVQIYVMWNYHQEFDSEHSDFSGDKDIELFFTLAAKHNLLVIVRAGPYICGDWDFGGFPGWLIKNNATVVLRSNDPQYMSAVDNWMSILLPKIKKHLYSEGGNVIMVQLENEYGSYYTCDKDYIVHLTDTAIKYLGKDVILFSTDGGGYGYLKCGGLLDRRLFPTIDYGPESTLDFNVTYHDYRLVQPHGPLVDSEFYTGWGDPWFEPHHQADAHYVAEGLQRVLQHGISVNMYMFLGSTNFGFWNGANLFSNFLPQVTSYDYDAPISENGDTTFKYQLIRQVIQNYTKEKLPEVPANVTVAKYPNVPMVAMVHFLQVLDHITIHKVVNLPKPASMESQGQYLGFVLYESFITVSKSPFILTIPLLRDLALVYWSDLSAQAIPRYAGNFSWLDNSTDMSIAVDVKLPATLRLQILVENGAHVQYSGGMFNNTKGILSDVLVNKIIVHQWNMSILDTSRVTSFPDDDAYMLKILSLMLQSPQYPVQGMFYTGSITFPSQGPQDSFIKFPSWCKGHVFINHVNLGRYWPCAGPQVTLYLPKPFWGAGPKAVITILELFDTSCPGKCEVEFSSVPELNGKHNPHQNEVFQDTGSFYQSYDQL